MNAQLRYFFMFPWNMCLTLFLGVILVAAQLAKFFGFSNTANKIFNTPLPNNICVMVEKEDKRVSNGTMIFISMLWGLMTGVAFFQIFNYFFRTIT